MARPQRRSIEDVLDDVATTLSCRKDLSPWTLAEIAPAAGLSPAGLIKRFGSRKGILIALSKRWIDTVPSDAQGTGSSLHELTLWVENRFGRTTSVAQGLSYLIDDLVDDELRALLFDGWSREIAYLASLLDTNEFPGVHNAAECATVLFDALNGATLRSCAGDKLKAVTQTLNTFLEMWT